MQHHRTIQLSLLPLLLLLAFMVFAPLAQTPFGTPLAQAAPLAQSGGAANVGIAVPAYGTYSYMAPTYAETALSATYATKPGLMSLTKAGASTALTLNEIGSVYGLAYDSGAVTGRRRVLMGAFARRDTSFGPGGPGAIYEYNPATDTMRQIATAPGVTIDGHTSLYPGMSASYSKTYDNWMQPWVGRSSLGDLELGPGGSYLYVADLQNRRVLSVNLAASNPDATWSLVYQAPGNHIPFALKFMPALSPTEPAYLAVGETDPVNLHAYVVLNNRSDGSNTTILDQDLTTAIIKERIGRTAEPTGWYAWQDYPDTASVFYPMPELTGIAFSTTRTHMILGFRDRFGDQYKQYDPGDDLRSTLTVYATGDTLTYRLSGGSYVLETVGQNPAGGCETPWPARSDYFRDSAYFSNGTECQQIHAESHLGAIQIMPSGQQWPPNQELVTTVIDPVAGDSNGVTWFSLSPYQRDATAMITAMTNANLWKSATIGDITPLADFSYLGARAWTDANANGVLDAGETPIASVLTELIDTRTGAVVTSARTGADGWAYFIVESNVPYSMRAAASNWNSGQPLYNMVIVPPDQGSDDTLDSDIGALDGTADLPGQRRDQVNTTIGMGFVPINMAYNTLGDRVWIDLNANGVQDATEPSVNGSTTAVQITMNCLQAYPSCVPGYPRSLALGATGAYQFRNVPPGIFTVTFTPPAGTQGSPALAGTDRTLDSNGSPISGGFKTANLCLGDPNAGCPITDLTYDQGLLGWVDLQITKSAPATAAVGAPIQYTLTYRNNSPVAIPAGAVVQDTLPAALTFVSASPSPSSTSGSTRSWTLGAIAAGASGSITINATVNLTAPASVANTATIAVPTGQTDTTPGNNTSTATTQILYPDLQITKSGPAAAAVGAPIQYTLAWRNNTAVAIPAGTVVQDTLPAGLTYVSSSPAATVSGSTLRWTLGAIAANGSGSITVNATVDLTAPASVANTATIAVPTGWPDTTPGNNTSTVTTQIQRPDVAIVKTGPATALVSDTISFTLAYQNAGTAPAAGVVVKDTLPAGLAFVSATPAPSSVSGQVITWNLGTLNPGASGTITVQAQVLMSAAVTQINTATVTTTSVGDPNPGNDTSTTTTTILRPNVTITKTAPANTAELSQLQYTLAYANNGSVAAAGVTVRDALPSGLAFVSASPAPSSVSGQTLTWNLGTLSPGATGTIVVTTRVAVGTGGSTLVNTATVATSTSGDDPSDNTSSTSTYVISPPTPPAASTDWKIAIRSALDPLSQDDDPANGVYVSNDSNVHWPAGEVLDWTPRVQLAMPGPLPLYPYAYRATIVGWSYVSAEVETVSRRATEADDMPAHGVGCRAGNRAGVNGSGLDGCVYTYIGTGALNDTTVPTESEMSGQAHGYWSVGVPQSMRNDVYTYGMSRLGAVKLNVQVKILIETYNVEDSAAQALRTRIDTPSNTYTLTLVVPRDLK